MYKFLHQKPIILASSSTNRYQLLNSIGLEFTFLNGGIDEEKIKEAHNHESAIKLAEMLAKQKALAVSKMHPSFM